MPYPAQQMSAPSLSNSRDTIIAKDFFAYQESFTIVNSGQTATGNINIQADSDFQLQKLTYFASISNATQTDSSRVVPLVTLEITDSGSGRNLFEEAVPIPSIFGTGQEPFILPTPKIFPARSTITLNLTNFSAATDYKMFLTFIGYKIFRGG